MGHAACTPSVTVPELLGSARACLMTVGRSSAIRRGVSRSVGPETLSAATALARLVEDGRGQGGEARARARRWRTAKRSRADALELGVEQAAVDDRARGERLERGVRRAPRGVEGEQHLADRRAVVGHAPADPLAGAEEVAALDLGEVLDAARAGDGEVDRLPRGLGERVHRALGELDQAAAAGPRLGEAQEHRAGTEARRASPCCWTRPWRSSAESRREAVLLGRLARSDSSVDRLRGARPRARRRAAGRRGRPIWVPAAALETLVPRAVDYGPSRPIPSSRPGAVRRPHVRERHAPLRDPQRGGDGRPRPRLAADRVRARRRVHAARGGRVLPRGGPEDGGRQGLPRPGVRARAGGQGAARVRPAGAQPRAQRPHRRRPHGLLRRLRPAVRARGRRAARRDDGRLRELRPALPVVPRARLAGRHDRRADRPPARLAPPRHGLRAADAVGQAVHGLGDLGGERARHDRHGRDRLRRRASRSTGRPSRSR